VKRKEIVIAAALIALAIGFSSYLSYKNKRDIWKREGEKYRQKEIFIENCNKNAQDLIVSMWARTCESQGKKSDCSLPSEKVDEFLNLQIQLLDRC